MQQAYSKERAATGGGPITQTYKELLVCATSVKWPQTVDSFVVSRLHATLALLSAVLVARGVVNGEQLRTEFTDLTVQATVTDTAFSLTINPIFDPNIRSGHLPIRPMKHSVV